MKPEVEGVILAGGLGKRMGELVRDRQKCMLLIEDKPILAHILEGLQSEFGSARVVIATGFKGETVKEYFGNKYGNIEIEYVYNSQHIEMRRRLLPQYQKATGVSRWMNGKKWPSIRGLAPQETPK